MLVRPGLHAAHATARAGRAGPLVPLGPLNCVRAGCACACPAAKKIFEKAIDHVLEESRDHPDEHLHMLKEMTANPDIPDVEIKDELLTMVMAGVRPLFLCATSCARTAGLTYRTAGDGPARSTRPRPTP